jgi:hypothetical protein
MNNIEQRYSVQIYSEFGQSNLAGHDLLDNDFTGWLGVLPGE